MEAFSGGGGLKQWLKARLRREETSGLWAAIYDIVSANVYLCLFCSGITTCNLLPQPTLPTCLPTHILETDGEEALQPWEASACPLGGLLEAWSMVRACGCTGESWHAAARRRGSCGILWRACGGNGSMRSAKRPRRRMYRWRRSLGARIIRKWRGLAAKSAWRVGMEGAAWPVAASRRHAKKEKNEEKEIKSITSQNSISMKKQAGYVYNK